MGESSQAVRQALLRDASLQQPAQRRTVLDFAAIYEVWFDHVYRWVRALGAREADREDIVQETFLVVRRRLGDFDGRNLPGWLYRIASRQVAQHRRNRWVKRVLGLAAHEELEHLVSELPSAERELEQREQRETLERILDRMSEKRRVAFVLFEVEGYSGEELAEMLSIPVNTVWTRLYHARKEFFARLACERAKTGGTE